MIQNGIIFLKPRYGTKFCVMNNGPKWPVGFWVGQFPDALIRRIGNVCRLRNRRGHWIRTDIHPYFNPCPSDRYESYGSPLPATDLVAHGGPTVVDALRGKPCPDDIDAVKCPHRDEQIAFNTYGQPVPYRAQTTKTTPEIRKINWCRHLPAYFAPPRASRGTPHFSNK